MSKVIKTVLLFHNGSFAVIDENGTQVPELQTDLLTLWVQNALAKGYDLSSAQLHGRKELTWERTIQSVVSLCDPAQDLTYSSLSQVENPAS